MKKNYLFGLSAMAAMLFVTSCQEEDVVKQAQEAAEATVSINVTTPEMGVTRAFGDGETAQRLHYAVYNIKYDADGKKVRTYLPDLTVDGTHEIKISTTVDLQLVTGNEYDVIFWADADAEDKLYTLDWETAVGDPTVSVNYDEVVSNNESYDAFYGKINFKVDMSKTVSVTLKRPFAQLNVGTSDIDEAASAGYVVEETEVLVESYKTLHLWEVEKGIDVPEAVSNPGKVHFNRAAIPARYDATAQTGEKFPVDGYEYLAMNYILRPADKDLVDVEFNFYSNQDEKKERTYASVPLQRNWRTNIYGQLITSDVDVNVTIDPIFTDAYNIPVWDGHTLTEPQTIDGITYVGTGAELAFIANAINGGGQSNASHAPATRSSDVNYVEATIKLTENIDLGGENWTPIAKFEGTFDGAGYTISNLNVRTEGKAYAGLFASSKGTIKNLTVKDAVVEGHYKAGVIAGDGLCGKFENCHVDNATVLSTPYNNDDANHVGGIVGYLSAEQNAWVKDCSVKNATITGYRDVAGIAGTANRSGSNIAIVTGNTVENVTITADQTWAYNAVKLSNAGAIVGRVHTDANVSDNTVGEGVKVIVKGISNDDLKGLVSEENAVVNLGAGEYTFPGNSIAAGATINCEEGTVFTGTSKLNIKGATVIGATFSNPDGTAADQTINGTFKDCIFEGKNGLRWAYAGETVVFEDCVFSGSTYGAHFDGGANDVIFRRCTFSGFNAFASAIELVTFEDCTFKSNGKSGYNGANLWGSAKMVNTKFEFDGSAEYEWIDCIGVDKTYEFTGCTLNGGSIFNSEYIFSRNVGTKITIDGVEYTWAEGDYLVTEGGVVVTNTSALVAAVKAGQEKIMLVDGTYEGELDLTGKKLSIVAAEGAKPVFNGLVWADNCSVTLEGLTLSNPEGVQHPNPSNSQYYNTINSQYPLVGAYNNADIKFVDCTFDIVAPTVYGFYGYAHNSPVFEGCTFNCNKIRPIANNGPAITVTGCTFNDQYHYAVRIFEHSGEKQTVTFTGNTIQGSNDKGEFEGINISKKGTTATVLGDFIIKGNTDVKYRHHENVTMSAECTYDTDITGFSFESE